MILSIIIPLYNKEKYIKDTIESVIGQTLIDYEVLIVNDGSTDHSLSIVESIKDPRIRIIDKCNEGVSATRNRGLSEAQGEYICFLDADDHLCTGALDEFNRMRLESGKCEILIGSFIEKDEIGHIRKTCINRTEGLTKDPMRALWNKEFSSRMGNTFIKKTLIERVGLMRTDLTLYEDKEWNLRLFRNSCVYTSTEIIMEYKRNGKGLSHQFIPINKDFAGHVKLKQITNKYEKRILIDFLFRRLVKRIIARDFKGAMTIINNNL